jgi:hypothetical protein
MISNASYIFQSIQLQGSKYYALGEENPNGIISCKRPAWTDNPIVTEVCQQAKVHPSSLICV